MNDARIEKLITALDAYARRHLSAHRYEHSRRVASFAEKLALHYGYNGRLPRLCFLAGISHDMCKEMPVKFLLRTVQTDGQSVSADEKANSELLHGRAAAVLLRENFGIHKKSVLNAVRCHTSASSKFDSLGRIIYIADKIEPGRKNCGYLRDKVDQLTLNALFIEVLKEVIAFVEAKGEKVQACTYKTYRFLKNRDSMRDGRKKDTQTGIAHREERN